MKNINTTADIKGFRSSDFPLVCYLDYLGFEIVGLDQSDERRKEFIFRNNESIGPIANYVDDFYSHKAIVEPVEYNNSIKNVKSLMYNRGNF